MTDAKHPRSNDDRGHPKHFDTTPAALPLESYRGEYGGRVRAHDPDTSWDVARVPARALSDLHDAVLAILESHGALTDDQLYAFYTLGDRPRRTRQRVGTARAELTARGFVYDTGRRGRSALGNRAILWEVRP